MLYAVIRIKGILKSKPKAKETLKYLRLNRTNHCVLVPINNSYKGMLQIAKDYITWGEINKETLIELISKRGKLIGNRKLTEEHLKKNTNYKTFEEFSQALLKNEVKYSEIKDIKPLFRLSPPKRGYRSVKVHFKLRGALGYRAEKINELIGRMI